MFECKRCGKKFEPKGFESTGTFYTLCKECGERILQEEACKTSKEAHERRMEVFWNDEERFCSDECSKVFLEECEAQQLEHELGVERRMKEGRNKK